MSILSKIFPAKKPPVTSGERLQVVANAVMELERGERAAGKAPKAEITAPAPTAERAGAGGYRTVFSFSYDGEKNLGEAGPIIDYRLDYEGLRLRAWQSYIESEITSTATNRFAMWIVGSGLKIQAAPQEVTLKSEGIELKKEAFNEVVEARFTTWSNSTMPDYAGLQRLGAIRRTAFINAFLGGDVLVVLRYVKGVVKVQLVDGAHVSSPRLGGEELAEAQKNGRVIRHGIEMEKNGRHVAYYVRKDFMSYERVAAYDKNTGLRMAYMVYGMRYRMDNHRGIPQISTVLETIKKLERYKEATVGSAEELAKIAYQIVHQAYSDGENPVVKHMAKAFNPDGDNGQLPASIEGQQLADLIQVSTNKQTWNMPLGAKMETVASNQRELHFKDFYETNAIFAYAAVGIPQEVALSKYDSNFSSSRAALKDWEHTIITTRDEFTYQFDQPICELWLHAQILENKISAPGYLSAYRQDNQMVLSAYRSFRWIGPRVPHIDPVKEVEAERRKLGDAAGYIPLTSVEQATENLNGGDSDANMSQFGEELKYADQLGIKAPQSSRSATTTDAGGSEEDKPDK